MVSDLDPRSPISISIISSDVTLPLVINRAGYQVSLITLVTRALGLPRSLALIHKLKLPTLYSCYCILPLFVYSWVPKACSTSFKSVPHLGAKQGDAALSLEEREGRSKDVPAYSEKKVVYYYTTRPCLSINNLVMYLILYVKYNIQ
uniref:Uncharacterized protein n=1 Tax=Morchella importuna TaxID=1174673 RepID=A0A650AFH0_9PEZI|nr:hypothetical protein [Morchella importuna]QGN66782.1 hypothetical protein [Morchella importuna]